MRIAEKTNSVDVKKTADNILSEYIQYEEIYKLKLGSNDDIYLKDAL